MEFNRLLLQCLEDLHAVLGPTSPDAREVVGRTLRTSEAFFRLQPDTRMVAKAFWDAARPHRQAIEGRDDQVMIRVLRASLPMSSMKAMLDTVWSQLDPANRSVVLDYVQVLHDHTVSLYG